MSNNTDNCLTLMDYDPLVDTGNTDRTKEQERINFYQIEQKLKNRFFDKLDKQSDFFDQSWGVFYRKNSNGDLVYNYGCVSKVASYRDSYIFISENPETYGEFIIMPFEEYKSLVETDEIKKYILGKINE